MYLIYRYILKLKQYKINGGSNKFAYPWTFENGVNSGVKGVLFSMFL